jgi:hypothetical protein
MTPRDEFLAFLGGMALGILIVCTPLIGWKIMEWAVAHGAPLWKWLW